MAGVLSHLSTVSRTHLAAIVVTIALAASQQLVAQDFDRYRPNPPIGGSVPKLPELPNNPVEGSEDKIVEALKGVLIIDHESKVQDPIAEFDGIRIHPGADLTVAREAAFKDVLQPYLGKPISIRMLNEMARNIVMLYRDYKQPVVNVSMPPGQDITDGVIQVVITESRIGAIGFRGNCHFSDELLERQSWLRSGQRIYEPCLQNELVWYNKNPFREVGVKLEPGDVAGTTDIIYDVKEKRPLRWYTGYDDTGTRSTGLERLVFGVNWGNAWGRDRQLNYQYTTDAHLRGRIGVHSLVYSLPIFENRDTWTVFGSWADFSSPVTSAPGFNSNEGRAWQVSGRYQHMLCESPTRVDSLQFGMDVKGTNSNLDFGGTTVFDSDVHVVQFMAGVNSRQIYDDGQTLYGLDAFVSPGHLLTNNTSDAFDEVRAGAKSVYGYLRGHLERQYNLNDRSDFVVRATGQISSYKLLPTEQMGFGGYNTVRGYDMRSLNGDNGYVINLEVRTRPIERCCNGRQTSLTALAFTDFGHQLNWDGANIPLDEVLASAGAGFRYLINPSCTVRFDYGYPIRQRWAQSDQGRVHIGAVLSY